MHAVLSVALSLSMSALLTLSAHHRRLSHAHSHTAVSDGICGIVNRDGFFIASGTDFIGLTVFQLRTAVKHGIVALCEITCGEDFFSGFIGNFDGISGIRISIKIVDNAGLCVLSVKALEHPGITACKDGASCYSSCSVIVNRGVSSVRGTVYDNGSAGHIQVSVGIDSVSTRNNLDISTGDIDGVIYRRTVFGFTGCIDTIIGRRNGNVSAFHIYGDSFQTFVGVLDIDGTVLHRQGIIRMERIVSRIDVDSPFFNCDITLRVQCALYRCDIKGTVLYGKELLRV